MKTVTLICISIWVLTMASNQAIEVYDWWFKYGKIKHHSDSGCRFVEFPNGTVIHSPSCDGKNHY